MKFKKPAIIISITLLLFIILIVLKPSITGQGVGDYTEKGKLLDNNLHYETNDLNVVFITIDALRADHLGCYGYERDTSPNIDKFAEDSLLFKRAYIQWPRTVPSMTSIFSSTYAHTNGIMRTEKISNKLVMLAEILKSNNYKTFGAVNNPVLSKEFNMDQGFEEYLVIGEEGDFFEVSDAQKLTESTIDWIEKNKDHNFFTWVHYMDPHAPYNAVINDNEHDIFIEDQYYNKLKRYAPIGDDAMLGTIPTSSNLSDLNYLDYYVAEYDAEIHYSDKWVGELLNYLKNSGLEKDTLIIISADHGESLSDHNYLFNHGAFAYDASTHVPLILHYPKELKVNEIDVPVPSIDITPTILDLLNIPPSNTMEGHSLLPLIFKNENQNNFIFTEAREMPPRGNEIYPEMYSLSIRDNKYKLIRNVWVEKVEEGELINRQRMFSLEVTPEGTLEKALWTPKDYELFDTLSDPSEVNELIEKNYEEYLEIGRKLDLELDNWFKNSQKEIYSSEGVPELSEEKLEAIKSLGYLN